MMVKRYLRHVNKVFAPSRVSGMLTATRDQSKFDDRFPIFAHATMNQLPGWCLDSLEESLGNNPTARVSLRAAEAARLKVLG